MGECLCVYCNLTWHRFLSLIFLEKNMNFNYHDRKSELMYTETQCILDSYVITSSIQAISLSFWCQAGQRLIEFCQENVLVIRNTLFQQHKRRLYTWTSPDGQHRIRLIIFFAAKDGEGLYSQQKQNQELTVAQTMNSLLPNSDLNWRK